MRGLITLAFCSGLGYQRSMNSESIDKLARNLAAAVPDSLRSIGDELEKNFRAVLQAGLGKLDLVTREEFEVQEAVLRRTREKLTALEARLGAVEQARAAAGTRKTGKKAGKVKKKTAKKASKKKTSKKTSKKPAARKPAAKKTPK